MKTALKTTILLITFPAFCFFANAQTDTVGQASPQINVEVLDQSRIQNLAVDVSREQEVLRNRLAKLEVELERSQNTNKLIREANRAKFESYLNNLNKRYIAGEQIIHHIIKETNQFNLSFSQLILFEEFAALSDPTTFQEFNNAFQSSLNSLGDRKPLPDVQDMQSLKLAVPMLANPLISTGMSLATVMLAKYQQGRKMRDESFNKMLCVLNYTTTVQSEYQIVSNNLKNLSSRLETFNKNTKNFFGTYLSAVGYEGGYERYVIDMRSDISDAVRVKRENFINQIRKEGSQVGVISYETDSDDEMMYALDQVKFYINEYETILSEIRDFINIYAAFIEASKTKSKSVCAENTRETDRIFKRIDETLALVRRNFNIVYEENRIKKSDKRILFGY